MPKEKGVLYIPRSITLPGGFKVKVNQIRPMKMKEKHGQFLDGCWDIDNMCVDVLKTLDHKRKWWVFSHEMVHVVNDWIHWLVSNETAKG